MTEGDYDMGPLQLRNNTLVAGIQSMARPTEVAKVDMAGGQFSMITEVNGHIYESIKMGKSEERYIKTKDGKDLQMWIIYRLTLTPRRNTRRCCTARAGRRDRSGQSWSYRWNYQVMAANGYIVVGCQPSR